MRYLILLTLRLSYGTTFRFFVSCSCILRWNPNNWIWIRIIPCLNWRQSLIIIHFVSSIIIRLFLLNLHTLLFLLMAWMIWTAATMIVSRHMLLIIISRKLHSVMWLWCIRNKEWFLITTRIVHWWRWKWSMMMMIMLWPVVIVAMEIVVVSTAKIRWVRVMSTTTTMAPRMFIGKS